ncbi:MAG: hypothetical protein E6H42_12585 [Betaproteobacteria bacterium]|nr:MAG: hypothetical protein E6H45_04105 [Betaproteobacteria bacterium]TMH90816.1 MAG: hypothetical protein E6H42_12585 [Betaproteobacteria bacterium]
MRPHPDCAGPTGAAARGCAAAPNRRRDCGGSGRRPPGRRAKPADTRAAARARPRRPCARSRRLRPADLRRPARRPR